MSGSHFDFEIADRPDEVDLRGIGSALVRRKRLIGGVTLGCLALALAFSALVKPRYLAEARILVENQPSYLTGVEPQPRENAVPDSEAINSQIQLLTSRDLARRAIKTLGLQGNPEFDPTAGGLSAIKRPLVLLGLLRDPSENGLEDRLLTSFFDHLAVYSPTKTRVLQVEFSSQDPDLAARGANVVADLYMDMQMQAKRDSAHQAVQTLRPLIASLEARVARADADVEAFRAKSGLFEGANNTNVSTQQLGEINAQLAQARGAQSDAQAKARGLREMLQHGRIGDVGDIANNDFVRRIAEQRVALRSQLALESRTLLPGHPRIKELQAQLTDIDGQLRLAVERAARGLENDAKVAAARVANLTALLDEQKQTVALSNADAAQLRELQRIAKTLHDHLDSEAAKYQADLARDASDASPADARIISRALSPSQPIFPKTLPIAIFATLAGLFFSAGYVIIREMTGERAVAQDSSSLSRLAPEPPREAVAESAAIALETPPLAEPEEPPAAPEPVAEHSLAKGLRGLKDVLARFAPPAGRDAEQEALSHATRSSASEQLLADSADEPEPEFVLAESKPAQQSPAPIASEVVGEVVAEAVPAPVSLPEEPKRSRVVVSRSLIERLAPLARHGGAKILLVGAADAVAAAGAHLTLARAMAREGRAVLVQLCGDDAVLRRALAPEAGAEPVGLAQLLKGEATFAEVIYRDAFSRLHIVLAGGPIDGPEPGLRLILDALEHTYDMMLIVAPHDAMGESLAAEVDLVLIFGAVGAARDFVQDDFAAAGAREILLADVDVQGEIVESAA